MRFPIDFDDMKPLGNTGEKIPAIGVGTWAIRDYGRAEEALVRAVEIGLGMIDTAEMYDGGRAEELVGRVVRRVGKDRVFITTKLLPKHFSSPDEAVRAAQASLRRLGLSTVDLILIHWPKFLTPIEKQVAALEAIAERGYARYIGVSNFDARKMVKAIYAVKKHEIVVNQVKYSPLDKAIEESLLPQAIKHGVTIQAYTPLEKGAVARHKALIRIGRKYGKSGVQVALNYLISRPRVVAIPKSERVERIEEFRGALGWRLSEEDIRLIEKL